MARRQNQPARPMNTPNPFGPAPPAPYPATQTNAFNPVNPAFGTPATSPQPIAPTPVASITPATSPMPVAPAPVPAPAPTSHALLPMQPATPPSEPASVDPLLDTQPTPAVSVNDPKAGAAVTYSMPPQPSDFTKNISSNEIEQAEAEKIAQELKQSLSEVPAAPAAPTPKPHGTLESGDTIVIDKDGNLKPRAVQNDSAAPTESTAPKA